MYMYVYCVWYNDYIGELYLRLFSVFSVYELFTTL